jgi:hypothetical protein
MLTDTNCGSWIHSTAAYYLLSVMAVRSVDIVTVDRTNSSCSMSVYLLLQINYKSTSQYNFNMHSPRTRHSNYSTYSQAHYESRKSERYFVTQFIYWTTIHSDPAGNTRLVNWMPAECRRLNTFRPSRQHPISQLNARWMPPAEFQLLSFTILAPSLWILSPFPLSRFQPPMRYGDLQHITLHRFWDDFVKRMMSELFRSWHHTHRYSKNLLVMPVSDGGQWAPLIKPWVWSQLTITLRWLTICLFSPMRKLFRKHILSDSASSPLRAHHRMSLCFSKQKY